MMSIAGFDAYDLTARDIAHRVFRKGSGPAVVIMHELPGMTAACISLAEEVADKGFCVHLPLLFGNPGDNRRWAFAAQLCIRREICLFAKNGGSPIVDWLRALCAKAHADCGGPGVGVIGLCLTGNFAIALMAEDCVVAPVASEPALPFVVMPGSKKALAVTAEQLARARARSAAGVPLMCLRFSNDRFSPAERFEAIESAFSPGFRGIVIRSPDAAAHIGARAHAVLTTEFRNEPGHPTRYARDQVLEFLAGQLKS